MNPGQILRILKARFRLVAKLTLGTALVALTLSLLMPRQYTASTSVVVDVKSPDPVAGMMLPAMTMPGYMATQVDIINSDRVAYRVIELLKLNQNGSLRDQWWDATRGATPFEAWYGSRLQGRLEVIPSRESNVIGIAYTAADPAAAAAVVNAFAQAYIDTNLELKVEPARRYATWFDQQGRQLRERVELAQQRLSEFKRERGLVATDERLDYENQKLAELQSQIVLAQTAAADAGSKQRSGRRSGNDTLPEVMESPIVQRLKAEISLEEAKLQNAASNLGRNHPQYRSMAAQIAELKNRLGAETARIAESITTTRRINEDKIARLRSAIDEHKAVILTLNKDRDQAAVLQREVDAAEKAANAVADRYNQSSLESHSTQTNISVLTPASIPDTPSSPRIVLNLLVAACCGLLAGIAAAIARELFDRRIRAATDLEQSLSIPLLASLPAARRTAAGRKRLRWPGSSLPSQWHEPRTSS